MLIDWFTVSAQALNFLILVWLMKRFLYRPIRRAIDAREQAIAAQLADAAASKAQAQREREEYLRKNEQFDQQRAALLDQAVAAANAERQRLLADARQAADELSSKRQETLRNDFENMQQAVGRRVQLEVFAIARKTLADLASATLEARLVEVFLERLRAVDAAARAELAGAIDAASGAVIVRSAFELAADRQAAIAKLLAETFGAGLQIRFETEPELISGIELGTRGRKLAWSVGDYLATLERSVGDVLAQPPAQAQAPAPAARNPPMSGPRPP